MDRINELRQAALDAATEVRAQENAYNALLDAEAAAKTKYAGLLKQAAAGTLPEGDQKALAEAEAHASAFPVRLSSQRMLGAVATDALARATAARDEEQARLDAEDKILAAKPSGRIQVGADRAVERPWAEGARGFGEFALAVRAAHTGNGVDPRLYKAAASGLNEALGPEGAFAVPMEHAAGIEKEMYEVGEILSRVDARNITGNMICYNVQRETSRVDGSRQGGVLGYWVDEADAPDPTKNAYAKLELRLKKVACLGYMTEELTEDAPALGEELQLSFGSELVFQVENKVYRGSGAGSPLGFLNAPCLVTITKETNQAAATINVDNLSKMWARVPAGSKKNAAWLINVDCEPQLDKLALPVGTAALEPRFVNYGPDGIMRIKGRPVIAVEYASTVGTVGDIAVVDLARYRLARKAAGVVQSSSIHVRFAQGENTFRAIYRCDGQPVPRSAITPFQGTNTLSPFVVLETRS